MKKDYKTLNIEITTACPLRCPQCYCSLDGHQHIPLDVAKQRIDEAALLGFEALALSGGETMCYPSLFELISYAKQKNFTVHCSFSGWHFNQSTFVRLVDAGIDYVCISLNGSTDEINSITRDGYNYALAALELLKANNFQHTVLNWVMHNNNAYDFENILDLADMYNVESVDIIALKPDANGRLDSYPTKEQLLYVRDAIRNNKRKVQIQVEPCFSPLRSLLGDYGWIGNFNVGPLRGCIAGILNCSVNVDGSMSPCRHIFQREKAETMEEFWNNSKMLAELRSLGEKSYEAPCSCCRYIENCRPCIANNIVMYNRMFVGFEQCPLKTDKNT